MTTATQFDRAMSKALAEFRRQRYYRARRAALAAARIAATAAITEQKKP